MYDDALVFGQESTHIKGSPQSAGTTETIDHWSMIGSQEQVMPGKVHHADLESRTARGRLKRGRQPHWQALIPGRAHLGYQVAKGDPEGRWVLRRCIGVNQYRSETLGRADDAGAADGVHILSFEQADAKARGMVNAPAAKRGNLIVREAMERYACHRRGYACSPQHQQSRADHSQGRAQSRRR
jgi:hypothetical protein